jgi:hypothetical protein
LGGNICTWNFPNPNLGKMRTSRTKNCNLHENNPCGSESVWF